MNHAMRAFPYLAVVLLASCAVGPDYEAPTERLEVSFKNAGFSAPPPAGDWWKLFRDPRLDALMREAERANPDVRAALARFDQARAVHGLAAADRWPAITADGYAQRLRDSANSDAPGGGATQGDYRGALNLQWEVDLWGRIRRSNNAARADADAAAYDYQAALTSLRGEIARTWFALRSTDSEIALLEETEDLRREAERLMRIRFEKGESSRVDLARATTELASSRTALARLRESRSRLENSLGTLTGRGASSFHAPNRPGREALPGIPAGVPADLLRRRPDLAAAERRLAAASERIGVTIANYLPRLSLIGSGGAQSVRSSELFDSGSRLWSLGPDLMVPIFQGGRISSDKARAEAAYREALENYRSVLLTAVQEAEDALASARHLQDAAESSARGAESARAAARLARTRYDRGAASYFEVVDAERTALEEERTAVAVKLDRMLASTRLIQALGGGWQR